MARRRRMLTPTPRRKRVWADQQITELDFAEDSSRVTDLLSDYKAAGGSTQGVTVARTVLDLAWHINETHTTFDKLTLGLIKGTTTVADAANVISEPYADWAYIKTLYSGIEHGLLTADVSEVVSLDVRSMRKIEEVGETWYLIFQGTGPVTVATFSVRARVRTLLLLP